MPRKKKEKTESTRMKKFKEKGLIGSLNGIDTGKITFKHFDDMTLFDRCDEIRDHAIALIQNEAIGSIGYQLAIDLLEDLKKFFYYRGFGEKHGQ